MMKNSWWDEKAGFFGELYFSGDHSLEGHLASKQLSVEKRTLSEVNGIVRLLDLKGKKNILDIPCGYGRHSIALALQHHEVTGVDINNTHLSIAHSASINKGLTIKFVKKNMLSIDYQNEYDIIINMFYSFGFFETDEDNITVLKKFFTALKPKGKFLMHTDVNIPRIRSGRYKLHESRTLTDGGKLTISELYNEKTKRIEGTWTVKYKNRTTTKPYSVRVYEKDEFIDMCLEVGFLSCKAFGGWHGEPYNNEREEIIFIATK